MRGVGPGPTTRAIAAVVAVCLAVVLLVSDGAVATPRKTSSSAPKKRPPGSPQGRGRHCGLFQSGHEWAENAEIRGHFYSYGVIHMRCKFDAYLPMRVAVLALHGETHPFGFACTIGNAQLGDGWCHKGNVKKRATVKWVVWAPEVDCADPNPPYTPAMLPSKCKS